MLLAIEGIDGAGKTHIARELAYELSERGHLARYLNKSDISFGDSFTDSRLRLLRDILWPQQGEPRIDLLGTHFYLFLLASWFSALGQLLRREKGNHITVLDGSHFRVIAKAYCRARIDPVQLLRYFNHAAEPDLVVLLEIDPRISWHRRSEFKETEIGRWDGYRGDPREAYCAYQSKIQQFLAEMARDRGWLVIRQEETTRDSEIVERIVQSIIPKLVDEKNRHVKTSLREAEAQRP